MGNCLRIGRYRTVADYKLNTDKIKELLNTPTALGVEVAHSISDIARQFSEKRDEYIYECLVKCKVDPDALKKTANKNKELMDTLADIYSRIESGELVEAVRCKDCEYWDRDNIERYTYSSNDSTLADFAECKFWSNCDTCYKVRCDDYCSLAERRADNEE